MRLIDADELRQRFIKRIQPLIGKDNSNERHEYMSWLRSVHLLDDMPTVDIVRCKDCKYCDRHHLVDGLFCYRLYEKYNKEYPQMIIEVAADDFCSRGEKKDDNENND